MQEISTHLNDIVTVSSENMKKMPSSDWEFRTSPEKWSKKEILGHLIDSAANNHQRFIRGQYDNKTKIVYDGNKWVSIQKYQDAPVQNLIGLWAFYNYHLSHIIANIPKEKYSALFDSGEKELKTLDWLVQDYVHHLVHHLKQILP